MDLKILYLVGVLHVKFHPGMKLVPGRKTGMKKRKKDL